MNTAVYDDYPVRPYIASERVPERETGKPVPRRNMQPLAGGLLAGDIILLWRIAFGTFTSETWFPKYLEYIYGINGPEHLASLLRAGYARTETAFESLDHLNGAQKRALLKQKGVPGLSAMKAGALDEALRACFTEAELASCFSVRGIALTDKGKRALEDNRAVIDRHPKKSL